MIDLSQAKKLITDGFSILTTGESKIPNFPWKKYQTEQIDLATLEKNYNYKGGIFRKDRSEIPATGNIGIICGYNDLEGIDVDLKVFSTAKEKVEFWDEFLDLLRTNIYEFDSKFVVPKTKNGGYHILYKTKRVDGNKKVATLKGHKEAVIETRGKGGYVFVYEEFLTKLQYADIDYISDEDREILFTCARCYDHPEEIIKSPDPKPTRKDRDQDDITPWEDFNQRNTVWDIVNDEFSIVQNLNKRYVIKRHGADSPHSGYIYKDSDLMYLFSSGTQYTQEKAYSAFTAYAQKFYNGDNSEAARQLYRDGYGTRYPEKKHAPIIKEKRQELFNTIDFPLDIFPERIADYIYHCHDRLDSVIDYMGAAMLWSLSLSFGNAFKIEVKKGWVERPVVWLALVGKAGIGKTPSIQNILFPFNKLNSLEIKRFIKDLNSFEEYNNLTKEEKKTRDEVQLPNRSQFVVGDTTLEALIDLHEQSKNAVGVHKDELAGWFKSMNQYRDGADLEHWLSAWSGQAINMNRKTAKSSFVEHPFMPVMGGIQPNILSNFTTEENKDNGFLDRFLFAYPDAQIERYNENEMPAEAIQWFGDTMSKMYQMIKRHDVEYDREGEVISKTCVFTPAAKKEWARIYNEITDLQNSENENEYLKSMYPKQKSYIPRFALLIHIINALFTGEGVPEDVEVESVLKAERLSKYFIEMAKKIKVDNRETYDMKKVIKAAASRGEAIEKLYKLDKEFNRSKCAEIMGVSRRTVIRTVNSL